ncbi:ATP-binding protein [Amycolatopsis sp. FDAARGOS 1241]|nr:ATP-binding protein [Amycolatopsis sp. FDAARGOS 1241]QRP49508.1 ATP-binding protein [Amycolatopsis sp. FDAARGOS 1241]
MAGRRPGRAGPCSGGRRAPAPPARRGPRGRRRARARDRGAGHPRRRVQPPRPIDGTITLTAELGTDGVARFSVADDGRWRDRARPAGEGFRRDHGLGLAMTRTLVDELVIDRDEHGTTASVRRRPAHPARLITVDQIHHGEPRRPEPVPDVLLNLDHPHAPGSRVAVHGPLDATSSGRLAGELHRLTLGGTHELTVDLTSVSHLAGAAVAVRHRSTADGRSPDDATAGTPVRL